LFKFVFAHVISTSNGSVKLRHIMNVFNVVKTLLPEGSSILRKLKGL